ncbi:hypothetical protein [Actinacidiphila bryophytorum]|uniref:DNA primase n=1 Tax=Actinacidiphila bryophytorum TaxID=1436133 RepID=A0A9W4H2R9_9ACTN|nr:hypothetical protein [Actinacidiphila bryophytorum]MBM9436952.1 hypothetical protein [Actinacidiphila bryophytorum]MBN6546083.1 hypothetical protein [Actinacidiphila bryophytorum]CAG7645953.1 conserved hypothetical protein [Actinacidiphila bryophytorum]
MNSTCRAAIAAAVAGGYVLGRTRKAKMAFAIGTFLAGRRFGLTPAALAAEGLRQLRESPQLAGLREQIGGDLLDAARAAASTSADRRFAAFADTLRERGREDLLGEPPQDEADEAGEAEEEDEEEAAQDSSDRRQAPAKGRKKAPAKKAAAKKSAAKKTRSGKTGPAKRTAKKTAAKKTASSRSRSTTNRRGR